MIFTRKKKIPFNIQLPAADIRREVKAAGDSISYKPDHHVVVRVASNLGHSRCRVEIIVERESPNSMKPDETVTLTGISSFCLSESALKNVEVLRQEVISEVRSALLGVEQHEMEEWFRVDGVMLNDPHSQGYKPLYDRSKMN